MGLLAANPCLWERVGQSAIDSLPPCRAPRPGKPVPTPVDPNLLLKVDRLGVEDKEPFTEDAADAWYELVLRTSQSLGMPYFWAERLEHVFRVMPRQFMTCFWVCRDPS